METKDRKAKGTVLLDYVRMIHATKDRNWDKYFTEEEWDLINGRILASIWYPFEIFAKCGTAVFHEIAQGSLSVTRQFGKFNADTLFQGTYKGTLEAVLAKGGGVIKFLERYAAMTPNLVNFVSISVKGVSEKHANLVFEVNLEASEFPFEPYSNQLAGTIERLAELAGGRNVKVTFVMKPGKSLSRTEYDILWD